MANELAGLRTGRNIRRPQGQAPVRPVYSTITCTSPFDRTYDDDEVAAMAARPSAEDLAYWFLRLNGCLTITNFLLHPTRKGPSRTDADVVAVRFPDRREHNMVDHSLFQDSKLIEFVIGEVKTRQPCSLNGPWTDPERQNIHYLLEAIGPFPRAEVPAAAKALYEAGSYASGGMRARLFAFGGSRNPELARSHREVPQLAWPKVLDFMHSRYRAYRRQKKDNEQWNAAGQWLYRAAVRMALEDFKEMARP